MQVVLPAQPPAATCAAATCTPHSTTATAATEQQEAERQLAEDPVPAGVAAVVLPYDYQVRWAPARLSRLVCLRPHTRHRSLSQRISPG